MAKKIDAVFDYQEKSLELESLLLQLQDGDIAVDKATKLYETGLKLIGELETYLKHAEIEVRKHTAEE